MKSNRLCLVGLFVVAANATAASLYDGAQLDSGTGQIRDPYFGHTESGYSRSYGYQQEQIRELQRQNEEIQRELDWRRSYERDQNMYVPSRQW